MGRGIRQGCPISPLLFLLVVQVMATHIKKASFHGISVFDKEIKLSQLADDTTIFVKNSEEVESVINCIGEFTEISGLKMNKSKSVLFSLKDCPLKEIKGIPIKDTVTYLGIVICKDLMQRNALHFEPIIEKIKNRYNMWLMRDLSLLGRILLSKAEGISRSVYVSMSMEVPKNVVKDLDKILYDFIWKRKTHYLRKDILNNSKELGGLEVLNFTDLNEVFKIKWIIEYIKNKDTVWHIFPNFIFNSLGGINFLLKCNFSVDKIPIKLASFHKQALLAWQLVYKHNFTPHRYFLWNNRDILYKKKSIFNQSWYDNGIFTVSQLLNEHGLLLSYSEFLKKFLIPVKPKDYAVIFDAISSKVVSLLRNSAHYINADQQPLNCDILFIGDINIVKDKCSNRYIRNILKKNFVPCSTVFWSSKYENIEWKKVWSITNKFFISNKVKEVSFKILHRIYPVKELFERFKLDMENSCDFCGVVKESVTHLFFQCIYSRLFWVDVSNFISRMFGTIIHIGMYDVIFFFVQDTIDSRSTIFFLTQLIILLGKYHIHVKKWAKAKPKCEHFLKEIKQYGITLQNIKNRKAKKTYEALCQFNLVN